MKQSAQQVDDSLSWKQEVNRRVAEHKERKGQTTAGQDAPQENQPGASAAAQAAARVAARYAKAPSYSELVAEEARAAVRAAEAASRAALQAQAAAESVLAGIEAAAANPDQQAWEPELFLAPAPESEPVAAAPIELQMAPSAATSSNVQVSALSTPGPDAPRAPFKIRWDADLPAREATIATSRASRGESIFEVAEESVWQYERQGHGAPGTDEFEMIEAAQPIHANLIHFPRELVAARRARPRLAEGAYAAPEAQLSIFEVEPGTISTAPEPAARVQEQARPASEAAEAARESALRGTMAQPAHATANEWTGPKWSGIELDAEPLPETAIPAATAHVPAAKVYQAVTLPQISTMGQRMLAGVVDLSVVTGCFLSAGMMAAISVERLPSVHTLEAMSVIGVALLCVLYQVFFFTFARATPGMCYAGLEVRTWDGRKPTMEQRWKRAGGLVLSLLPLGLGAAWAVVDEQQLSWHDRLSQTYIRHL